MANIAIDGFVLKSYEHGWIIQKAVQRTRLKDDPEGRWKAGDGYVGHDTLCYASGISKALQRVVEHAVRDSDASTLGELRDVVRELQKTFEVATL